MTSAAFGAASAAFLAAALAAPAAAPAITELITDLALARIPLELRVDLLLRLPAFFCVPFLLVPRVDLLADFLVLAFAALFPDFLPAAFLEPLEPDFLLERFRALLVAIYLLTETVAADLQKQRLPIAEEALPVVDH